MLMQRLFGAKALKKSGETLEKVDLIQIYFTPF